MKRVQILIATLCLLWCAVGVSAEISVPELGSVQEADSSVYADIGALIDAEKFEEAVELCNTMIVSNPEDTKALYLHSEIMLMLQRHVDALIDMDNAIALKSNVPDYFLRRSYVKYKMKNYQDALKDIQEVEDYGLCTTSAHEYYGRLLIALEEYDQAWEEFDFVLSWEPDNYSALQGRARSNLNNGYFDEARRDIEKMFRHSEADEYAYLLQSQVLYKEEKYDQAMIEATIALEVNPNFYFGYKWRAKYHIMLEKYKEAKQDALLTTEIDPQNVDGWYELALAQSYLEQYRKAISTLDHAIAIAPEDWYLYYERADNYYYQGNYRKAIPDYTLYHENTPDDIWVLIYRGYCYHAIGKYDKAIEDYTAVIEEYPDDAEAYRLRSDSYAEKEDFVNAFKDMLKAVELERGEPFIGETEKTVILYSLAFALCTGLLGLCVLLWFLLRMNNPMKSKKGIKKPPPFPPAKT